MARGHVDLPPPSADFLISKQDIYAALLRIDADDYARRRVLSMETGFRQRIATHLRGLPTADARFQKFNTSPFVLLFHSRNRNYSHVSQIEQDIIPAKVFSSMETSAGRMVEEVVLPAYGWAVVPSKMHTAESILDGRHAGRTDFRGVTLKSGPRCLNDEMAQNLGRDVAYNAPIWAKSHGSQDIDFTYGVLYGTKKQSNKKDWHILRSIAEALPISAKIGTPHRGGWTISYHLDGLTVTASVRIGIEWWSYLGGPDAWLEVGISLIRACIDPAGARNGTPAYVISDLAQILDTSTKPNNFNTSLIQESQLEWVLFYARHMADGLVL